MEELSGNKIPDESITEAIRVYNQNRSLLQQASELRKQGKVTGSEFQDMVISSMITPKKEHNAFLIKCIDEAIRHQPSDTGVNLFISASMLDDSDFVALIEESGGRIVADDMPMGSRYFHYLVEENISPLNALAKHYLTKIPCPRKMLPNDRKKFITEILNTNEVKGAIIHNLKACDCHLYEYPFLKKTLEAEGLPVVGDMSGHPSMSHYTNQGYEIITF